MQINLDEDEWLGATVIDRAKVSGKYYNYFNVLGEDGLERNMDLERLEFRKMTEEEVNMVKFLGKNKIVKNVRKPKLLNWRNSKVLIVLRRWTTRDSTGSHVDGYCGRKELRFGLGS